jgi:hypothetical protein
MTSGDPAARATRERAMSRLFGPVRQIGYVVPNLDQAIEHWVRNAGIGPFFRMDHMPLTAFRLRGVETRVDLSVACANSGDMQIELIEQHNPEPSPYKDFLDRHGAGLQHFGMWSNDYEADIARLLDHGHQIAFDGEVGGATRFTYFDSPFSPGTYMEVADFSGGLPKLCDQIRGAAVDWDGRDPVRHLTM